MPSALKDSRACKPTKPMPRYISDGSGRDIIVAFGGELNPPSFYHFSENRPQQLPKREKHGCAKIPVVPKFVPDGSGRDMFQQQNNDYVRPVINMIRAEAICPKRKKYSSYNIPKSIPKFLPSGSGRDMGYTDINVYQTIASQNSFKILRPSASNTQVLRPRTSPPPRFQSSGSGRDTFQNPSAHRYGSSSHHPQREGFHYGSETISQNARYRYGKKVTTSSVSQNETMKRLCSPNTRNSSPVRAKSASGMRLRSSTSSNNNNKSESTFDDYFCFGKTDGRGL